jgi:hypothetical protein
MRLKNILCIFALLCAVVQGAWAQKLNFCTASDVNRVVCTDGSIYDNASAAAAAGKTAVAKIIYIDEVNKKGLALALKDEGSFRWEGAKTVCSNKNTSLPFEDATWKLASKDEWDKMINAAGGYIALRDGFAAVGGDNIRMGQYWSGDYIGYVYIYQFASGDWTTVDTGSMFADCNVRLCLQFNLFTLYEIGSQNEWSAFCTAVNNGDTFSGKYVKLTADISVSEMAGSSESNSFQGLFDGDGHTLTVSYNTEYAVTAPFRYVNNATIRNLKTTGTITTGGMNAAGIVGEVAGSLNLSSCNSSVSISSSRPQMDAHGGLVASNNGNVTISGCVFDGSFAATVAHNNSYGTTFCGGIVGMCVENKSTTITNSLVAPSSVAEGMVSKTFVGLDDNATVTIENCYFVATANLPTNQGMQVYYTAPANGIYKSITFFGTTVYSDACSVSGVEATYNLDNGLASVTPMLTDPSAAPLTFGTDYTATLDGNAVQNLPVKISTAGSYTLVLTGTGNYAGSKTFNITATGDVVNSALAISSEEEWNAFAESVNNGTNYYSDKFVKLNSDISVSTMVGASESNSFQGIFLGDGHTLTFTAGSSTAAFGAENCAPFRYTKDATIRDLKVAGDIYTSHKFAAGLVASCYGTTTITNCQIGTVIHSSVSGDGTHGGIVAMPAGSTTTNITGCVYNGRLLTTSSTTDCGGFVGWSGNNTVTVTHSLYAPDANIVVAAGETAIDNGATFVRGNKPTVEANCYYTETMGSAQGTHAYALATAPANFGNLVQDYGKVKAYENGILYGGKYYVAPASLNGSGTKESPYVIDNEYDWICFAASVNNGTNYSGQFVKLYSDISVSEMVGSSETNSFQGTFLGDGVHTLNFTAGSSSAAFGAENCAPFRYTKNATIRDLKVTGTIYTSRKFAAGLVARNSGTTTITNCQIGTVIHSSVSGDGTHGGIVAMPAGSTTTNITGCVYNGRLLTNNNTTNCGGFVGWSGDNTVTVAHSLYAPDANIVVAAGETAIDNGATFVRGNKPTVEANCYYTETMGGAQGTQCFPAAVEPTSLGELVKEYSMLKVYQSGVFYDGTCYMVPVSISLANNSDNSSTISDNIGFPANVTLSGRTLYKDGSWNTLCLPFNVDSFTGTPLEGATVKTLASTSFSDGTLTLDFTDDVTSIEAGKPYIVKWAKPDGYTVDGGYDISEPMFNGVIISDAPANAKTDYVDFMGCYSPVSIYTAEKTNLYLGADNKLYYPTASDFTVNAFRGYFQLKLGDKEVKAFNINFGDDEATGIISVHDSGFMVNGSDAWYTLDGRKLQGKPTQRGIYINNGKKTIIK